MKDGVPVVYAKDVDAWRSWLEANGQSTVKVWLVIYHASSATSGVGYAEAVEHGLCFGWIDSKTLKRDEESFYQTFSPRKPKSTWSKVNRERAQRMIELGLMAPAGQATIDLAKQTGAWDSLADAQNLIIPEDLQRHFDENETAFINFQAFPRSSKQLILEWITKAKRPETRHRRIAQTVEMAERNERANHPRPS